MRAGNRPRQAHFRGGPRAPGGLPSVSRSTAAVLGQIPAATDLAELLVALLDALGI